MLFAKPPPILPIHRKKEKKIYEYNDILDEYIQGGRERYPLFLQAQAYAKITTKAHAAPTVVTAPVTAAPTALGSPAPTIITAPATTVTSPIGVNTPAPNPTTTILLSPAPNIPTIISQTPTPNVTALTGFPTINLQPTQLVQLNQIAQLQTDKDALEQKLAQNLPLTQAERDDLALKTQQIKDFEDAQKKSDEAQKKMGDTQFRHEQASLQNIGKSSYVVINEKGGVIFSNKTKVSWQDWMWKNVKHDENATATRWKANLAGNTAKNYELNTGEKVFVVPKIEIKKSLFKPIVEKKLPGVSKISKKIITVTPNPSIFQQIASAASSLFSTPNISPSRQIPVTNPPQTPTSPTVFQPPPAPANPALIPTVMGPAPPLPPMTSKTPSPGPKTAANPTVQTPPPNPIVLPVNQPPNQQNIPTPNVDPYIEFDQVLEKANDILFDEHGEYLGPVHDVDQIFTDDVKRDLAVAMAGDKQTIENYFTKHNVDYDAEFWAPVADKIRNDLGILKKSEINEWVENKVKNGDVINTGKANFVRISPKPANVKLINIPGMPRKK